MDEDKQRVIEVLKCHGAEWQYRKDFPESPIPNRGLDRYKSPKFVASVVDSGTTVLSIKTSEVHALLSPLSMEMVEKAQQDFIAEWSNSSPLLTERDRAIGVALSDFAKYVMDRLRQQLAGGGADG